MQRRIPQMKSKTTKRSPTGLGIPRQPINPGIVWVAVDDREVLLHGRLVLELCASAGSHRTGVPFQDATSLMALHTGPYRQFQETCRVAGSVYNAPQQSAIHRVWVGPEGFNFLCDEGLREAMRHLPAAITPLWTSFCQPLALPSLPEAVNALTRMQSELRAMGHYALVFSGWPAASADQALLRSAVDETVFLERCETEPKALLSFRILLSGGDLLGPVSAASMMVDAHLVDSHIRYRIRPFVSKDLLDRYIWTMRAEGRALEAIAQKVSLNKSTVKRRLDKLPPAVGIRLPDGWEAPFEEAFESRADE